jgi:site-specific recombinase XerD
MPSARVIPFRSATPPRRSQDLTVGFLLSLRASGRSPKTERIYREALENLQRFADANGLPEPAYMTTAHLRAFLMDMYERGLRDTTVAINYRSLRSFYKWLVTEEEREDDPLKRISPPKVAERVMPHYGADEVERLLVVCGGKGKFDLRDTALILTLFDSGLRGSELCGLDRDDVDLKALTLHVRQGKGKKERLAGIGYRTAQVIDRYLRRRGDDEPALFLSRYGDRMTFNGVRLLLQRRFGQAGLKFSGTHAFRRGFAIAYLESGGSPEDLRVLAGWDSPSMVLRYTKATKTERALRGHRQHSPADKLR